MRFTVTIGDAAKGFVRWNERARRWQWHRTDFDVITYRPMVGLASVRAMIARACKAPVVAVKLSPQEAAL